MPAFPVSNTLRVVFSKQCRAWENSAVGVKSCDQLVVVARAVAVDMRISFSV